MLSEHVKRWHALSVFPADFDEAAAAAVWELMPDLAKPVLNMLQSRSLVRHDPACRRYRLHERARLLAAERIAPDMRLAVRCRHAFHYAAVAAVANEQCERGPIELLGAMRFFRLEWPNLEAAFTFACERAPGERLASQICSDLARSCANWLLLRIPPAERLRWLEPALAAARTIDDPAAVRTHLRNLTTTYEAIGDAKRSCQTAAELLSLSVDDEADGGDAPEA